MSAASSGSSGVLCSRLGEIEQKSLGLTGPGEVDPMRSCDATRRASLPCSLAQVGGISDLVWPLFSSRFVGAQARRNPTMEKCAAMEKE